MFKVKSTNSELNLKNTYNRYASEYAQEKAVISEALKSVLDKFIALLPSQAKVLDLGCGPGRDAKYYVENGLIVTGFDFSEVMVNLAQLLVPSASFEVKDIITENFGVEEFDGIAANSSLLHVPKSEIDNVLDKIYFSLKRNGIFWLGLKAGKGEHVVEGDINGIPVIRFFAFYSKEEIRKLLKLHGFEILEFTTAQSKKGQWYIRVITKKITN